MRLGSFIQWGFLVFIIAIFIYFEAIHLQVLRYNLFLLLLISLAYIVILCIWILERRVLQLKEGDSQGEEDG
jgi:hypothetical protein